MGVGYELNENVAVITLAGTSGEFPWGTKVEEHRINPETVAALNAALDKALANEAVQALS
jgi:hypothetical protein